jgi:hypothetical protein
MSKLAFLIGTAAVAVCMASAPSWAALVDNTAYVDPEYGTDSATCGNQLLGPGFTDTATGPCATLNQALQNLPATGGLIIVMGSGTFGPIYLTAPVAINAPSGKINIDWQSATTPGCVHGAPGSCNGGAAATYAVDIEAAAATATVKLRNVLINANGGSAAALHIGTAFGVSLNDVALRCGPGSSTPEMMLVDSSQGSQLQIYLHNSDVAFCSGGGGIVLAPTGATPVRLNSNHAEVHNATFGLQANSTGLTGTANIAVLLDDTQFFSFNNSAVSLVSSSGSNGSIVSITRSAILNTGGAALKANGVGAGGLLYESVILGNSSGVNVLNGAGVATYQNNEFAGNGNDCESNSVPAACSTVLTPKTPD